MFDPLKNHWAHNTAHRMLLHYIIGSRPRIKLELGDANKLSFRKLGESEAEKDLLLTMVLLLCEDGFYLKHFVTPGFDISSCIIVNLCMSTWSLIHLATKISVGQISLNGPMLTLPASETRWIS